MSKKIAFVALRMEESMLRDIKGLAAAEGLGDSALIRMAISDLIEKKRLYHAQLNAVFGGPMTLSDAIRVEPCSTGGCIDLDQPDE